MNIRQIIALAFLIAASKFSVAKEPDHLQQIDQALSSVTENNINAYRYIFKDKSGRTSDINLLIAILLYGSDFQLQQALKLGADPNTVHAWGGTALEVAVLHPDLGCQVRKAEMLLEAGALVDENPETGDAPIHAAAANKQGTGCLELLVVKGAEVSKKNDLGTPVFLTALLAYNKESLKYLYENGADPFLEDNYGNNVFYSALMMGALLDSELPPSEKNKIKQAIIYVREMYKLERKKDQ